MRPDELSWILSDEIRRGEEVLPIRSISNPNEFFDPKFYKGKYWHTSRSDNYGVHTNSGVLNYWCYIIANGGSGINEVGYAYDVEPIGIEKALKVVYRMMTIYLNPNSDYSEAQLYGLIAVEDLFGSTSLEYQSVSEACRAVGLPYQSSEQAKYLLSLQINDAELKTAIRTSICKQSQQAIKLSILQEGASIIPAGALYDVKLDWRLQGGSWISDPISGALSSDLGESDIFPLRSIELPSTILPEQKYVEVRLSFDFPDYPGAQMDREFYLPLIDSDTEFHVSSH